MYVQELSIAFSHEKDKLIIEDEFYSLTGSLRKSGQTQGKGSLQFFSGNRLLCYEHTIEEDSLDRKYNNYYVNKKIKEIEEFTKTKLEIKTMGKLSDEHTEACKCKNSKFYILITNLLSINSPVSCGSCYGDISLYKLPVYNDYGYGNILSWESNYQACDTLNMNCEVGEVWAMKQMWRLDSALSKQGVEICNKLTELTNIPTYYYLYNYRRISRKKDLNRKCPCCGGEWLLKEELHRLFNFKCDKCRLISSLSSNR